MAKKTSTKEKVTESYKVLSVVPYQLCPKCNGDGEVMVNKWNGNSTSISVGMQTCDVCNGAKIIPMYVMPVASNKMTLCTCNEEDKHGETAVMCCNECGKPTEKFWDFKIN